MIRFWTRKKNRSYLQTMGSFLLFAFLFSTISVPFAQASRLGRDSSFWSERKKAVEELKKENFATDVASVNLGAVNSLQSYPNFRNVLSPHSFRGAKSKFPLPVDIITKLETYGDIERVHLAPNATIKFASGKLKTSAPLVIQIQDAHGVESVQSNIAHLLWTLMDAGAGVVGVEGSAGKMERMEEWRRTSDRSILAGVAGYFMKEGTLSGVEVAGLDRDQKEVEFFGVEEKEKYLEQVKSFKDTLDSNPEVESWYQNLGEKVASLKSQFYTPEIVALDRQSQAYEKGELKLGEWVEFLSQIVIPAKLVPIYREAGIQTNLSKYIAAYQLEKSLDFKKIEEEQKQVIKALGEKLNRNDLAQLLQESLLYRTGKMGYGEFYGRLKERCKKSGVTVTAEISKYIQYVVLVEGIDREYLFKELKNLEEVVWDQTIGKNQKAKEVHALDKNYALIGKAIDFKLNVEDYMDYILLVRHSGPRLRHSGAGSNRNLVTSTSFLDSRFSRWLSGDKFRGNDISIAVKNVLENAAKFNELSQERNEIFIRNLTRRMKEIGTTLGVLVAGGYHSSGVEEKLKENGISYITIRPKMDLSEVKEGYDPLQAFRKPRIPLEEIFSPEKISMAPSSLTGSAFSFEKSVRQVEEVRKTLTESVQQYRTNPAKEFFKKSIAHATGKIGIVISKKNANDLKSEATRKKSGIPDSARFGALWYEKTKSPGESFALWKENSWVTWFIALIQEFSKKITKKIFLYRTLLFKKEIWAQAFAIAFNAALLIPTDGGIAKDGNSNKNNEPRIASVLKNLGAIEKKGRLVWREGWARGFRIGGDTKHVNRRIFVEYLPTDQSYSIDFASYFKDTANPKYADSLFKALEMKIHLIKQRDKKTGFRLNWKNHILHIMTGMGNFGAVTPDPLINLSLNLESDTPTIYLDLAKDAIISLMLDGMHQFLFVLEDENETFPAVHLQIRAVDESGKALNPTIFLLKDFAVEHANAGRVGEAQTALSKLIELWKSKQLDPKLYTEIALALQEISEKTSLISPERLNDLKETAIAQLRASGRIPSDILDRLINSQKFQIPSDWKPIAIGEKASSGPYWHEFKAVAIDSSDQLLLIKLVQGDDNTIYRFNPLTGESTSLNGIWGLEDGTIFKPKDIAPGHNGEIWVLGDSEGIPFRLNYRNSRTDRWSIKYEGFLNGTIESISVDQKGFLWCTSSVLEALENKSMVYRFNPQTMAMTAIPNPSAEEWERDFALLPKGIKADRQGHIWVIDSKHLGELNPLTGRWLVRKIPADYMLKSGIDIDPEGNVLLAGFTHSKESNRFVSHLLKYNPHSDEWTDTVTKGIVPYDIAIDSVGNIFTLSHFPSGKTGILLKAKPAKAGNILFLSSAVIAFLTLTLGFQFPAMAAPALAAQDAWSVFHINLNQFHGMGLGILFFALGMAQLGDKGGKIKENKSEKMAYLKIMRYFGISGLSVLVGITVLVPPALAATGVENIFRLDPKWLDGIGAALIAITLLSTTSAKGDKGLLDGILTLDDLDTMNLDGKKVFVRVDYNVPLDEKGNIVDNSKILETLYTIHYLLDRGARVILLSHLGRPWTKKRELFEMDKSPDEVGEVMRTQFSLAPVAKELKRLLGENVPVSFALDSFIFKGGLGLDTPKGGITLLENLMFNPSEQSKGSTERQKLANTLYRLADIIVNDSAGNWHDMDASTANIPSQKIRVAGRLIEKEAKLLSQIIYNPKHPIAFIFGGGPKFDNKVEFLRRIVGKTLDGTYDDILFIGSGPSGVFKKAKEHMEEGLAPNQIEDKTIQTAAEVLTLAKEKNLQVLLPEDLEDFDIGPQTRASWKNILSKTNAQGKSSYSMILWNGPLGMFEIEEHSKGTQEAIQGLNIAIEKGAQVFVLGANTGSAARALGLSNRAFYSTTGGAGLTAIAHGGKNLPGLDALRQTNERRQKFQRPPPAAGNRSLTSSDVYIRNPWTRNLWKPLLEQAKHHLFLIAFLPSILFSISGTLPMSGYFHIVIVPLLIGIIAWVGHNITYLPYLKEHPRYTVEELEKIAPAITFFAIMTFLGVVITYISVFIPMDGTIPQLFLNHYALFESIPQALLFLAVSTSLGFLSGFATHSIFNIHSKVPAAGTPNKGTPQNSDQRGEKWKSQQLELKKHLEDVIKALKPKGIAFSTANNTASPDPSSPLGASPTEKQVEQGRERALTLIYSLANNKEATWGPFFSRESLTPGDLGEGNIPTQTFYMGYLTEGKEETKFSLDGNVKVTVLSQGRTAAIKIFKRAKTDEWEEIEMNPIEWQPQGELRIFLSHPNISVKIDSDKIQILESSYFLVLDDFEAYILESGTHVPLADLPSQVRKWDAPSSSKPSKRPSIIKFLIINLLLGAGTLLVGAAPALAFTGIGTIQPKYCWDIINSLIAAIGVIGGFILLKLIHRETDRFKNVKRTLEALPYMDIPEREAALKKLKFRVEKDLERSRAVKNNSRNEKDRERAFYLAGASYALAQGNLSPERELSLRRIAGNELSITLKPSALLDQFEKTDQMIVPVRQALSSIDEATLRKFEMSFIEGAASVRQAQERIALSVGELPAQTLADLKQTPQSANAFDLSGLKAGSKQAEYVVSQLENHLRKKKSQLVHGELVGKTALVSNHGTKDALLKLLEKRLAPDLFSFLEADLESDKIFIQKDLDADIIYQSLGRPAGFTLITDDPSRWPSSRWADILVALSNGKFHVLRSLQTISHTLEEKQLIHIQA